MTLPPLNLNLNQATTATSGLSQNGAQFDFGNDGWTVNLQGSGFSNQSAATSNTWIVLAAAAAVAVVFYLKK